MKWPAARGTELRLPINRRTFLKSGVLPVASAFGLQAATPQLDPNTLAKYVDPLPILPVAKTSLTKAAANGIRVPQYRLDMRQAAVKLHRDLPATPMWTFNGSFPGPTIEARHGSPIFIEWANRLPANHFLPIDHRLHGAEADKPEVRTVVHVHGAKVSPENDGWPEDWYTPGKSRTYFYPNNQDPATLWYHDHAMGINRLNIYAGLAGLYVVRDEAEDRLKLPGGAFEIPLVICDRFLLRDGSLDYPVSGHADAPWVPEVFGNAMLVNGKLFPYLDVEARLYRFRILNAANGRFFHLSLSNDLDLHFIGNDQGLLPSPIAAKAFVIAPGERVDVVVDFAGLAGEKIILRSDSFELMQFRVGRAPASGKSSLPQSLRPVPKLAESSAVRTRVMTIDEFMGPTGESMQMLLNNAHWMMPITEKPVIDTVEIWSIVNPTDDSHPIHLHLVRFQILDRRRFNGEYYKATGEIRFGGAAEPPEPSESGWKDTVRAHANMVTRFIVRFEGYTGKYVWHCHVLEHEDNEMMRPFEVVAR